MREMIQNKNDDKRNLEEDHSRIMNQESVQKISKGLEETESSKMLSRQEYEKSEKVFFEDDEQIRLRDGKEYKIAPCTLKNARKLMKLLETVNIDAIILNFLPPDDEEGEEENKEKDLYDILLMSFENYPHITKEYIDEYVDLDIARKIIEIMIGLNEIKK